MNNRTISNTKKITKFLKEENVEKTKIFKILKCEESEANFLRFLLLDYIEKLDNSFIIGEAITEFYSLNEEEVEEDKEEKKELNFEFIEFISSVKKLLSLGWIFTQTENFDDISEIDFLSLRIHLDQSFLYLIQNDELIPTNILKIDKLSKKENYNTYLEYLQDNFLLTELLYERYLFKVNKVEKKAPKSILINETIKKMERIIKSKLEKTKIDIPFEVFSKNIELSYEQKIILMALLKEEYKSSGVLRDEKTLIGLISDDYDVDTDFEKITLFNFKKLKEDQGIEFEEIIDYDLQVKKMYFLSEFLLNKLQVKEKIDENQKDQHLQTVMEKISKENNNIFEIIQPNINLEEVVFNQESKEILEILTKQNKEETRELLISWGVAKENQDVDAKIIFHGKPGTGKTLTSSALAVALNKKILSFDCSKILDMYVGESEKNVRKIFDTYKNIVKETGEYPILLLNEADQFLSSRNTGKNLSGNDKMTNQMQNIFLEQIEEFNGILIATTNLISNLDKAFSRRFNYKIEFKLPNAEERQKIWEVQLPKNAIYKENVSNAEIDNFEMANILKRYELSGGQINLIIKNTALKVACREDKSFYKDDFIESIKKEEEGSFEKKKTVGFNN